MLFNQALASTVLGKIVADKEIWIAARKVSQPLETFQATLTPSDRDFVGGLRGKTAFILECKKASPSKGLILKHTFHRQQSRKCMANMPPRYLC